MANKNKDATDFMIEEYGQIASAYFGLRDQVNEWFKAYITLIGLPLTVLAAVLKLGGDSTAISIFDLPDIVSGLLVLVSLLGFFVTLSIVSMRMEMILYARTINGIRRYFAELDRTVKTGGSEQELVGFLVLPTTDTLPPFFEKWRAMFWQVLMIGFLDGTILAVAVQSISKAGYIWSTIVGIAAISFHFLVYWGMAKRRDKEWHVHFEEGLRQSNV